MTDPATVIDSDHILVKDGKLQGPFPEGQLPYDLKGMAVTGTEDVIYSGYISGVSQPIIQMLSNEFNRQGWY